MKEFWDQKFNTDDYLYGVEPNEYFKTEISKLKPGKLLVVADGEGRNATYAARNNWDVKIVDYSKKAKEKALKLAKENKVSIEYIVSEIDDFEDSKESYDCVAMTFLHLPPHQRERYHKKLISFLKPG